MDFSKILQLSKRKKDIKIRNSFIAKVFGAFNEDIVRIWANRNNSKYKNLGRPTIYRNNEGKRNTLDFTMKERKTGKIYISEMKSWISYKNNKFLELNKSIDLLSINDIPESLRWFLNVGNDISNYDVNVNGPELKKEKVIPEGTILIWPKFKSEDKDYCLKKYRLFDLLSLENIIIDLNNEKNEEYFLLLKEKEDWFNALISGLKR